MKILTIVILTMVFSSLNAEEVPNAPAISSVPAPSVVSADPHGQGRTPGGQESLYRSVPIPLEPAEDSVSDGAPESASEGEASEEDVEESVGWFDMKAHWKSITSWKDKQLQSNSDFWMERDYVDVYGPRILVPGSISGIKKHELALRQAQDVREQRDLDRQVREDLAMELRDDSHFCLTVVLWRESRGETVSQEASAANVIFNRLSVGFRGATTICEVITTPNQFTGINKHGIRKPSFKDDADEGSWERSMVIARRMMDPDALYIDTTNGALYYYNREKVFAKTGEDWVYAKDYRQTAILGNHRFMGEKNPKHRDYIDDSIIRLNPVLFNGLSHEERNAMKKQFRLMKKG